MAPGGTDRGGNLVVVGLQWGDEGKGKVVDLLARTARYVVRFQGGNNAGHTLVVGGEKVIVHLVPSGVLQAGTTCVVGNGVVVGPEVLVGELDELAARGHLVGPDRLALSGEAHVVMPYHLLFDGLREEARGAQAIGTTRRGIGPCYEDKVARRGIRLADFVDAMTLQKRLADVLGPKNRLLTEWFGQDPLDIDAMFEWARPLGERLAPYLADTVAMLHSAIARGERILFEGAQGTFLDVDHGTYPFVTSSNTVAGAACTGAGVGPRHLGTIIGATKAYTTRVGSGPFPTEVEGPVGERLREQGGEFGATTGRPRRCGWFDAVALRHSARLNGTDTLALTKLDVLSGLDHVPVCTAYQGYPGLPAGGRELGLVQPVYEELPGWTEDIGAATSWDQLPPACQRYVERLEQLVEVPVGLISTGPGRDQVILRDPAFQRLLGEA